MEISEWQKEKMSIVFGFCVGILIYLQLEAPNINPWIAPVVGVIFVLYLGEMVQDVFGGVFDFVLSNAPKAGLFAFFVFIFYTLGTPMIENVGNTIEQPIEYTIEETELISVEYINDAGLLEFFGDTKTILTFENGVIHKSNGNFHKIGQVYEIVYFDTGRHGVYIKGEFKEPEPVRGATNPQLKFILLVCVVFAVWWALYGNRIFYAWN
jgi:hypothetical protein